jgi:hypothetical protein
VEFDQYSFPMWVVTPPSLHDFLDTELPSDEAIMEVMASVDRPWEDMHHQASFLPNLERLEVDMKNLVSIDNVEWYQSPIMTHDVYSKGNLENISKTIPINILVKPGVMEHILIGAYCSPREIELYTSLFKELCDIFLGHTKKCLTLIPDCHRA